MKRAILAWECGAGRGHVIKLKTVAEALRDRFSFYAVLHDIRPAGELSGLVDEVFPCDSLKGRPDIVKAMASAPGATWAEYLHVRGFCDPAYLIERVGAWRKAFALFEADVLIAAYAPAAMLAARTMGLPVIVTGTGYGTPPAGAREFAVYLDQFSKRFTSESEMCAAMNAAITHFGGPELARAPELYDVAVPLVTTIGELDPYPVRPVDRLPPGDDVASFVSDGKGEEVYIYFSTVERKNAPLIRAIKELGLPVRAFMPGASEAEIADFSASGIVMENAPVPVDLLARRTRLMVHAGQHGIVNLALAAGIPQFAIPQHMEHLLHASRIKALGMADYVMPQNIDAGSFRDLVHGAYNSQAMQDAAQDFARIKRPIYLQDIHAGIREACAHI